MLYLTVLLLAVTVGFRQAQGCTDRVFASITAPSGNIVRDMGWCNGGSSGEAHAAQVCERNGLHLATLAQLQELEGTTDGFCSLCNWSVGKIRRFCSGQLLPEDHCTYSTSLYVLCSSMAELQVGWTEWSDWGPCTETSCQGIQIKTRTCQGVDAGVSPCEGLPYELQNCNVGTCSHSNQQQNKAEAACQMLFDLGLIEGPVYGYEKERKVGTCSQVCGSFENCGKAVQIYPNVDRRLNRDESQLHLYPNCNTTFSNACCCKAPKP